MSHKTVIRFGTADAIYDFEVMPLGKRKDTMKFNLPITMTATLALVLAGASPAQQQVRTDPTEARSSNNTKRIPGRRSAHATP
jgi:hypothetical protein